MSAPISILINNYNYGRFLGDAIDSALGQAGADVEVIVVDDGSTDESRAVIAGYGDRIRAVLQANGGQASAFNAGFAASSGEIVLLLDADDRFLPVKAKVIASTFAASAAGWCSHPLAYIDAEGRPDSSDEADGRAAGAAGPVDVRDRLQRGEGPGFLAAATSGLGFRRSLLEGILPMPTDIRITADNYLKAVALGTAPGVVLADRLAEQRLHGANAYTGVEAAAKRAAVELRIAGHLLRAWPTIRPYAFARGLGALKDARRANAESDALEEAAAFFRASCTGRERARLLVHAAAWKVGVGG